MNQIIPIRALKDNYIWMIPDTNLKTAWVVDPGDAQPVIKYLHAQHLKLAGILITHHHADHSAGVPELLKEYGNVPVYGFINSKVPLISHFVKEGDEVICGQIRLKIAEIPGHTLDHIVFYNNEMIFCGDTLFSAGCGRVFEGTYEQMFQSLGKLLAMTDQAKIYCGHEYTLQNLRFAEQVEPDNQFIQEKIKIVSQLIADGSASLPSILHDEKNINPFLRYDENTVIQAAEKYAKDKLATSVEVFKSLREWKNHF